MPVTDIEVESIKDLVGEVLSLRAKRPKGSYLWFRGLNCKSHSLLPKLMRDSKSEHEVFEREKRLLTRFRQRSMAYWPAGYPQDDWEHLFAMQHYGLPTRLLDWSENLFVAAYFALSTSERHHHDNASQCVPVVWCIDPVHWNRSMPGLSEYGEVIQVMTTADDELEGYRPETTRRRSKSPVAIFGAHNSDRIVAQRGTFMVWGAECKPLHEYCNGENELLVRISLRGLREELFHDIESLGFSETMVFPELSSLGTELSRTEGWRS